MTKHTTKKGGQESYQKEAALQSLRPLLEKFAVGGANVYDSERVLSKLAVMPDYVVTETLNGLRDGQMPASHYKILLDKWGKKDAKTKKFTETPQMVFYRAARLAADGLAEGNHELTPRLTSEVFYKFVNREIFPNTPYMANGGHKLVAEELEQKLSGSEISPDLKNELQQQKKIREQLLACFVLDIHDSRVSIFKTLADAASIQASIGGTGFNFSDLRPANETIHGTGGITDGPISFMAMYSHALGKAMNQGGKREGANMFMLDWNHPDIIKFIYSKSSDGTVSAANISVAIDHDFMKAAKSDDDSGRFYPLKNPHYNPSLRPHVPEFYSEEQLKQAVEVSKMNKKAMLSLLLADNGVDVLSPWLPEGLDEKYRVIGKVKDGTVYLDAKKVLRHLAFGAWFNGEPGAIITGHINDHNPTHPRHFKEFLLEQKDPEAIRIVDELRQRDGIHSLEKIVGDYVGEKDETGRYVNLPIGVGELRATNPCGEKPLLGNEACVLGHKNLEKILRRTSETGSGYEVDFEKFEENTRLITKILDNAIDQNYFTNEEIAQTQRSNRKIGVGFMGLANMLYRLELPYNSQEARDFVDELLKVWEKVSDDESFKMGEERGAFPNFKYSHHKNGKPKRNAIVRTLAPTGTTGFAAQTTGGIEPEFALAYTRTTVQGTVAEMFNPVLQEKLEKYNPFRTEEEKGEFHKWVEEKGGLQEFKIYRYAAESEEEFSKRQERLSKIKNIFVTANDINPEDHLRMQAIVQNHVDDSISKTTNFKNNATIEDVENAFIMAYDLGIKGITFYRDGARMDQPLQVKGPSDGKSGLEKKVDNPDLTENAVASLSRARPEFVGGLTQKEETPFGLNVFVTLNWEKDGHGKDVRPYEAFVGIGKGGGDLPAIAEGYGRLLSLALKAGVPVEYVAHQLEGIGGENQVGLGENRVRSLPDAIARALRKTLNDEAKFNGDIKPESITQGNGNGVKKNGSTGNLCPSCGKTLTFTETCEKCASCGFSKC